MKLVDDRTEEQKVSHSWAIVARDSFMSGWGGASGGTSRVAWAFDSSIDNSRLERWVRDRREMKNVNVVNLTKYRAPKGTAHFHIYVVNENHPSLG
jgi:hypothetical protein